MTNAVLGKTKNIEESYALQYGVPSLANGVLWDGWSSRVSVCAERMVVVFEASNETARRDDAGVGLLRWREGVPLLGQPEDVFEEYALRLSKEVVEEEDSRMLAKIASQEGSSGSRGGKKKAAPAKGTTSDIGRGRDVATVRSVVKGCALQAAALGVRGAMVASQALDDAYWTGSSETPRVLGAAWSPPMCGGDGGLGSMMAVCFDDGSLMLFSKPTMMTAFWVPEVNLSRVQVDVDVYNAAKRKHVVRDVVIPGTFLGVAWSGAFTVKSNGASKMYSVIGGITEVGALELYRVTHVAVGEEKPARVASRVVHVGTVRLDGECITQVTFMVSARDSGDGDGGDVSGDPSEIAVVCGCESGVVTACGMAAGEFVALEGIAPGIDGKTVDLVSNKKLNVVPLVPKDGRIAMSLAASCAQFESASASPAHAGNATGSDFQVIVAVGKTVGIIQVFIGGRARSLLGSFQAGKPASVPAAARPDMHSISGLAFLHSCRFLVANSRLGNSVTLSLPNMELQSNPVHHTVGGNRLQYGGFGSYGLAASPGGAFIALAKQSQEPDREFRIQQQVHQMVTQGYLHIQSIAGVEAAEADGDADMMDADTNTPSPRVSKMAELLVSTVIEWSNGSSPACALWDAGRMAALLESLVPYQKMVDTLRAIQNESGVHLRESDEMLGTWTLEDDGQRTSRFAAAMLHVLRALQGDYQEHIVKLADWEMISMKGHIASILANAERGGAEKTAAEKLTGLLAIDFVVAAHQSHPWIFTSTLLKLATGMYSEFDGEAAPAIGRPISTQLDANFVAPITTMFDGSLASMDRALTATVVDSSGELGEQFDVMRCPATLQGNLDGGNWICSSCKRSYSVPPRPAHLGFTGGIVACTLCASTKVCLDIPYHI